MSDDDIHDMMDRAHYAEIREQRLRIEVDRLKAENERLRAEVEQLTVAGIHTCHDECQRVACVLRREAEKLKAENERLTRERDEAFRMSRCECGPDECCANLVKLHEGIARLRRDAERYGWICRFPEDADYEVTHALNGYGWSGNGPSFRDLLSDAIDAALAAKGEK